MWGASLGSASIVDLGDAADEWASAQIAAGASSANITYTSRTGASKFFGGMQVSPNFAVELGYANLGSHKADGVGSAPGVTLNDNFKWKISAFFVDAVGSAKLGESFSLFGRLGLDEIIVHTEHGYVDALMAFFRARTRRPHGAVRTGPRGVLGDAAGREITGREHPGAGARDSRVPTAGRRR